MEELSTYQLRQLFALVSAGDDTAFRELFDRYKKPFFGVCMQMSGSRAVSEEVVQETFIRVWEKRALLQDLENPQGYLYRLFHHVLLAYFRKIATERKANGEILQHWQPEPEDGIEEKLRIETRLALLHESMKELTPQQATVFRLIKLEGLSRNLAAEQLGISPNTVRNLLLEAMRTLRKRHSGAGSLLILLMAISEWQS